MGANVGREPLRADRQRRRSKHHGAKVNDPAWLRRRRWTERVACPSVARTIAKPSLALARAWLGGGRRVRDRVRVGARSSRREADALDANAVGLAVAVFATARTGRMASRTSAQPERAEQPPPTHRTCNPHIARHAVLALPMWRGGQSSHTSLVFVNPQW
ncbi:hypothetical protein DB30_05871 [Enhygromyxa salina]|uniref:Uncharacterized protein n=1 Tax=Enhygromyxa salina TaxID=215803 RepID=A0A0C2CVS0_9BACT|nr:hypothetical protein DB30_05871 [Enhygromyxa salina]